MTCQTALAAVAYARLGWPILPIRRSRGPRPEYASTAPAVIVKWWAILPDAWIGLATGHLLAIQIGPQINDAEYERWRLSRPVVATQSAADRTLVFYRKPAAYRGIPSQNLALEIRLFGTWDYVTLPPSDEWHWLQDPFERSHRISGSRSSTCFDCGGDDDRRAYSGAR
jgi:hypothetical protein